MQIKISALTHTFPGSPPKTVLDTIETEINSGEFTALVGPSGCGKTTLLRLIADLLQPSSGEIRINGHTPAEIRTARQSAWMAQSPALLPWLSARQNVSLAVQFAKKNGDAPEIALARVGLHDLNGEFPAQLSGGMQQRVALARLLVQNCPLWLMDEPFAALDEITRENLAGQLASIWAAQQPTVVWVTHNIYEAIRLADRVLVFSAAPGRIIADIAIRLPRPRNEADAEFQALLLEIRSALQQAAPAEV